MGGLVGWLVGRVRAIANLLSGVVNFVMLSGRLM